MTVHHPQPTSHISRNPLNRKFAIFRSEMICCAMPPSPFSPSFTPTLIPTCTGHHWVISATKRQVVFMHTSASHIYKAMTDDLIVLITQCVSVANRSNQNTRVSSEKCMSTTYRHRTETRASRTSPKLYDPGTGIKGVMWRYTENGGIGTFPDEWYTRHTVKVKMFTLKGILWDRRWSPPSIRIFSHTCWFFYGNAFLIMKLSKLSSFRLKLKITYTNYMNYNIV